MMNSLFYNKQQSIITKERLFFLAALITLVGIALLFTLGIALGPFVSIAISLSFLVAYCGHWVFNRIWSLMDYNDLYVIDYMDDDPSYEAKRLGLNIIFILGILTAMAFGILYIAPIILPLFTASSLFLISITVSILAASLMATSILRHYNYNKCNAFLSSFFDMNAEETKQKVSSLYRHFLLISNSIATLSYATLAILIGFSLLSGLVFSQTLMGVMMLALLGISIMYFARLCSNYWAPQDEVQTSEYLLYKVTALTILMFTIGFTLWFVGPLLLASMSVTTTAVISLLLLANLSLMSIRAAFGGYLALENTHEIASIHHFFNNKIADQFDRLFTIKPSTVNDYIYTLAITSFIISITLVCLAPYISLPSLILAMIISSGLVIASGLFISVNVMYRTYFLGQRVGSPYILRLHLNLKLHLQHMLMHRGNKHDVFRELKSIHNSDLDCSLPSNQPDKWSLIGDDVDSEISNLNSNSDLDSSSLSSNQSDNWSLTGSVNSEEPFKKDLWDGYDSKSSDSDITTLEERSSNNSTP